jgi:hypothetical protein
MPSNQTREQLDERNRIQKTRYANDEEYRKGVAERGKEWRDKYQWTRTEKQKLYREENRNEINVRALSSYHKKKKVIYDLLGNECKHCGEQDPIYFQIDHVNNDGSLDRNKITLKKYLENPERYQLLCANCNWAKRMNNGKLYKPKKRR